MTQKNENDHFRGAHGEQSYFKKHLDILAAMQYCVAFVGRKDQSYQKLKYN